MHPEVSYFYFYKQNKSNYFNALRGVFECIGKSQHWDDWQ